MELSFNNEDLFNNEILKQYDENGQLNIVGYLMKNKKFIIENNNIIFPTITSQSKIRQVIDKYNKDCIKEYLKAQKIILDEVLLLGIAETKNKIDDKIKKLETEEKKTQKEDRY